MSVTPEQLAAYADGELDAAMARTVEQALAQSTELQARLAAHRALKARLAAHFAPVAAEPVPDRLTRLLQAQLLQEPPPARPDDGTVIDFAAARERQAMRPPRTGARAWARYVGPALAASLILAIVGFGLRPSGQYAQGALADALGQQLTAGQTGGEPVRILISFRDRLGAYCRGYAQSSGTGIACRDDSGWKIVQRFGSEAPAAGEYRQAGSGAEQLFAAAQNLASGAALDDNAERAAIAQDWQRR